MKQKLLQRAIQLATSAHRKQYDRGGAPYILHPLAVMEKLRTRDEELKCIAILHDIIEDTSVTEEILYQQGMTKRIVDGVLCLTKVEGQTYEEYQEAVFSNVDAMKVKMCDLAHNSDITRLKGVTQKDILRIEKYMKFYKELQKRVE